MTMNLKKWYREGCLMLCVSMSSSITMAQVSQKSVELETWESAQMVQEVKEDAAVEADAPLATSVWQQIGLASWYGPGFHGRKTSTGERFDSKGLTAAHPSLPLGSRLWVRNLDNGRELQVRVNDRGPRGHRFIIDLSEGAAEQLGFRRRGVARVHLLRLYGHH